MQDAPQELRDQTIEAQQKLLDQYSNLVASNLEESTIQAIEDQITHYELLGIKQGFNRAKKRATEMMQTKLNQLNQTNTKKVMELRENMPSMDALDEEINLEAPDFQASLEEAHNAYGVIAESVNNKSLPDDLSEALEA